MTRAGDSGRDEARGLVILGFGVAGMSTIPVVSQLVMRLVPPPHFSGFWMVGATLWAAIFAARHGVRPALARARKLWRPLVVVGLLATGWVYLYFYGVARLDAAVATFVINSRAVWGVLLGIVFFGERPSIRQAVGIVLSVVGVALVFAGDLASGDRGAMVAVLGAAVLYVALSAVVKRSIPRDAVPIALVARFALPALLLSTIGVAAQPDVSYFDARAFGAIAVGSLVGPFLSFLLVFTAMPRVRLGVQSVFQSLGIVFTAIVSFVVFGTVPTPIQYAGGALILGAVILVGDRDRRPRAPRRGSEPQPTSEEIT